MATVTTTTLIDDLDPKSKADVTVTFTVDGQSYSVDLSKANYAEYVAPLVEAGRTSQVRRPAKRATAKRAAKRQTALSKLTPTQRRQIRVDLKVPRGRISDAAVAEWKKR